MVHIRKARAGSDSFGNEWPEDGAAVDVPVEQAAVLMAIPDGGFSEAPAPKKTASDAEDGADGEDDGSAGSDPDKPGGDGEKTAGEGEKTEIDEAPKPPARRGRKPKTADAGDKTVEE